MIRYLKQYKFLLFLTVLFTAISSLSYVFIAILLQQVMDIVDMGDMDGFIRILLFSLAYFALMGVFMYLQSLFSKKFVCKIMKSVRSKTFMGIEKHTIEDYSKNNTADYLSAITNDVKMIEDNFLLPLLQVIQYTIIFIASLAVIIYFDIIVTVCVIIAISIMLIVPSLFGGLLSKRQDKYSDMLSSFTNHVKDLLSGFEIIKSYRMKEYVLSRFETSNEDTIKAKYSVDKAIAANEAVSMVLALLVQVVVVFLSAYFIIIGRISAGALLGMVQVSSNLANPLLIIFSNIPKIKSIKPIAQKLNEFSDYRKQDTDTKKSPTFNEMICVEDLHFSYDKENEVISGISLSVKKGKKYAFVGKSGCGKSTLINETLQPILSQKFYRSLQDPLEYDSIEGLENIDKVVNVDQSPLGRTPRSNPATYTGVFSDIRNLFVGLPEAKIRGYKPGRFSFNVSGGRCEACQGNGYKTIEMNFLPDVYVPCEVCHGKRYNRETLEVRFKGKSIADVLDMTINRAVEFFENVPQILNKIKVIQEVGLGYIKLGQSSTTLSGGESQRVKLATELSKRDTGKTLYILDEPTTGLHFEDIRVLMNVLNKLVDKGNTVIVIEHNLDVIKMADYIIDMGPDGGKGGGQLLSCGTPEEVAKSKKGYTPKFLKEELKG